VSEVLVFWLRFACINVPIKVGREAWEKCFLLAAMYGDIFGINENLSAGQRDTFRDMAREMNVSSFGLGSPNPVFWNPKLYRRISSKVHLLHGPGPERWRKRKPGYNAERYATVVVLLHLATDQQVTAINTHWAPRSQWVPIRWRLRVWAISTAKIAGLVAVHTLRGRIVALMGDFNMKVWPRILNGMRWLTAKKRVDKLGVAPNSRVEEAHGSSFEAPTDHGSGVRARVLIRLKKKKT